MGDSELIKGLLVMSAPDLCAECYIARSELWAERYGTVIGHLELRARQGALHCYTQWSIVGLQNKSTSIIKINNTNINFVYENVDSNVMGL